MTIHLRRPDAAADRAVLDPGVGVVPKCARSDRLSLWVGACVPALTPDVETLRVDISVIPVGGDAETERITGTLERYWFTLQDLTLQDDAPLAFYHGHFPVPEGSGKLSPNTAYAVTARLVTSTQPELEPLPAQLVEGRCTFRTLPEGLVPGTPLEVVAASCYDPHTDPDDELGHTFERRFGRRQPPQHMTLLCGDQVYLDAPWYEFRRRAARSPRPYYLERYWSAWGMAPGARRTALRPVLQTGANWFIPDDHEFWNNFPHGTPLVLHSLRNEGKILRDRLRRLTVRARGRWPKSLVHPPCASEWEEWSRAAFELYASFQTPSPGGVSHGAADPPEGPDDPHCPFPYWTPVLQTVDVAPARFVLLDTRTRRTRSARSPQARFIDDHDLARVIELAGSGDEEAGVFVLVLAQPLFKVPVPYDNWWQRTKAYLDFDRGLENYRRQYHTLWSELLRARRGRPTVVVGGDVHYNRIALARELSTLEIIASPMSLVTGLATLGPMIRKVRRRLRPALRRADPDEDGFDLTGVADARVDVLSFARADGLTRILLDREPGSSPACRLTVEFVPRSGEGYERSFRLDPSSAPGPTITQL